MLESVSSDVSVKSAKSPYRKLSVCRVCRSDEFVSYLDLGRMPLVNSYVSAKDVEKQDPRYPLEILFCPKCAASQLSVVVDPTIMYKNYFYRSSISKTFVDHCARYAASAVDRFGLTSEDLVVDIASNDGAALETFKKQGVKVLGVDPATNLAEIANSQGIPTHCDFWSLDVAKELRATHGPASFITGTNVFAHVDDVGDFLVGVQALLKDTGIFAIEVPYAVTFLKNTEFDTTYHEHLSYFLLKPLVHLFKEHGLEVFDVEFHNIHGGSIRVFAKKFDNQSIAAIPEHVEAFLKQESELGLHDLEAYRCYNQQVVKIRDDLSALVKKLKTEGKKIAAYGASAKGNILTNFCQLDRESIEYIIDDTPEKQGYYSPGNHIPIVPASHLASNPPDYLLLLAWNFADELMAKTDEYRKQGGKYIIPIPQVRVI